MSTKKDSLKTLTNVTWVAPDGAICDGLTLSEDQDGSTMVAVRNAPAYGGVPAIWIDSDKLSEVPAPKKEKKNGEAKD